MRGCAACWATPSTTSPPIHLTGTNGKGSTARIVTRCWAPTASPSAPTRARTSSGSTSASPATASRSATRPWRPLLTDLAALELGLDRQPSYFELLTAAAFRWFSDEAVDVAVVEVGLLGRWDATNVVDGQVAVLTNVGHDHTDGQGDWRRRIAEEKAGHRQGGRHLRAGRDRPGAAPTCSRPPRRPPWCGATSTSAVEQPSWRSAAGCRPPHARARATTRCSCRCTVAHQGENAAGRRRRGRGVLRTAARPRRRRGGVRARSASRVGSRSSAATRW